MVTFGFVLALVHLAEPSRLDFQLMNSPAYEVFARKAEALCPARKLRYLHPAELDGIEEGFLPSLARPERRRIATVNRGIKGCGPAGLSCPAQHTLAAIEQAGLLDRFVRFSCVSAD